MRHILQSIVSPTFCILILCTLAYSSLTAADGQDTEKTPAEKAALSAITAVTSITKEGVLIVCTRVDMWRDWQPMVSRPGPDGGSPLKVVSSFTFTNTLDQATQIHWEASLTAGPSSTPQTQQQQQQQKTYPVELWNADAKKPWAGVLQAKESKTVILRTSSGPYLKAGTMLSLNVLFNIDGEEARLRSHAQKILATH